jgi:CopG family nickel-responsive transcriptional regulator
MQRITITIDDDLLTTLDALMEQRGYPSRSEALRELCRDGVARKRLAQPDGANCIAALSYVYDHETRALAQRLADAQHNRHDLTVASLHIHLDHNSCLEVAVLRGRVGEVRALADSLTAQRGVRHGSLHLIPAEIDEPDHQHVAGERHTHIRA